MLLSLAVLYVYGYRLKQRQAACPFYKVWHGDEEIIQIRLSLPFLFRKGRERYSVISAAVMRWNRISGNFMSDCAGTAVFSAFDMQRRVFSSFLRMAVSCIHTGEDEVYGKLEPLAWLS